MHRWLLNVELIASSKSFHPLPVCTYPVTNNGNVTVSELKVIYDTVTATVPVMGTPL